MIGRSESHHTLYIIPYLIFTDCLLCSRRDLPYMFITTQNFQMRISKGRLPWIHLIIYNSIKANLPGKIITSKKINKFLYLCFTHITSIISLGKSMKRDKFSTIGKFGLGFNCVYHLTDVVSFISRDSYIIFDPRTAI